MDNIKLLEYCAKYPEKFLDSNYMFMEKDKNLHKYINRTKLIKEKLIAIKEIINKKNSEAIVDILFEELRKLLDDYANYSEFGAFINACDSKIEETYNDLHLLKEITKIYLIKRDVNDIVPGEWIQALIDKGSSRKKGHVGESKLINILIKKGFKLVNKLNDFKRQKRCVVKSTTGEFSNKKIKQLFKVNIARGTQDKKIDLIIKNNKSIYFLEAKHLNTGGGGQNKQVLELSKIIKKKCSNNNYHFVAFLDGIYSNSLLNADKLSTTENKIKTQNKDIFKTLKKNKNNYWINTAGFKKLFI
ncbi:hypothetical protein KKI21_01835 [Patescibacteria group bacterium]|nr:hypothetical protein [Patescibacteria group bacterium]MCG2696216.1 hypothetical protein [Candidatus Portnoybacteria bacterium]